MNKKLILNKTVIAELNNPFKIVGGEGGPSEVSGCAPCLTQQGKTCDNTCKAATCFHTENATCDDNTCITCVDTSCPKCPAISIDTCPATV
jgi:hypothetical protein